MQHQQCNKVRQFKRTFIRNNVYINRRDYDGKWEVVKKLPYLPWSFKGRGGKIVTQMRWVTQAVHDTRQEALTKAKELGDKRFNNNNNDKSS